MYLLPWFLCCWEFSFTHFHRKLNATRQRHQDVVAYPVALPVALPLTLPLPTSSGKLTWADMLLALRSPLPDRRVI